ncbi:hypothetical protein TNCV_3361221 [Trichonephila clavipes]|nr:hypothetical protein TNCV_3361221 [Trichonephila clavipes]
MNVRSQSFSAVTLSIYETRSFQVPRLVADRQRAVRSLSLGEGILNVGAGRSEPRTRTVSHHSGCKLPHDVALSGKAPLWSPVVFLVKFAPIVESGHQHSMADTVPFLSYPRYALLERDLATWQAKKMSDKL